jgi:hypothetical protein
MGRAAPPRPKNPELACDRRLLELGRGRSRRDELAEERLQKQLVSTPPQLAVTVTQSGRDPSLRFST